MTTQPASTGLEALSTSSAVPEPDESASVQRLAVVVASAVELLGVDGIGVMLLDEDDTLLPVGSTNPSAAILQEVQAELRSGPGVDCTSRGESVAVSDLASDPAYADLWARVQHAGIRAVLSAAVRVRGIVVGNLNAVMHQPHDWTADQVLANEAYAKVVAVTLDLARRTADAADLLSRLRSRWRLVRMSDTAGGESLALE